MKNQSFTMRLFSVLLCVAMLCTFAPLTTLAKVAEQVFVGGVEVTADNANDVLGDGTVSYDKYTKTLTLNGAAIYDPYDTDEGSFGIFATGDLNVVLEGRATIDFYGAAVKDTLVGIKANGNLNVTGKGTVFCHIPPVKDFAAGLMAGGALTIDVSIDRETMMYGPIEFTEISVAKAAESYALFAESIDITLGNAPIVLMAKTAAFSTAPTLKNYKFVDCDGGLLTPDCDDFEPLYEEELLNNIENLRYFSAYIAEIPDVEIGGVKLTLDNADDVLGDGTVYFDTENWTLVFDNANITGYSYDEEEDVILGVAAYDHDDLSICLVGENVIDLRDAMDTKPQGAIGIFDGNGYEVNFFGDGSLTVYTGDAEDFTFGLNLRSLSLYDDVDLTVCAGNANGMSRGMYVSGDICTYGSGDITAYGGNVTNGMSFGMDIYSDLKTYGSGDITAYGGDVTNGVSFGMHVDDVCLKGVGDCLFVGGTVGESGESYGAYAWGIDLYGGKNEEGVLHGVRFIGETGAFQGDGSAVPYRSFHDCDYTTLCAQTMSEDDLAEPDDSTNSIETAKYVLLRPNSVKEYGISVGGTWVTANNAADVLGDGTVSYDAENYVLTLNNAKINNAFFAEEACAAVINESGSPLYVRLIGDNVIDLTEADLSGVLTAYGVWSGRSVSFYDNGSLTVKVPAQEDTCSYGIYSNDDIWVYGTAAITVELPNAENTYGFYCDECGIDSPNVSLLAGDTALYAGDCVYSNTEFTVKYLVGTEYNGEVSENDSFGYDFSIRSACKTVKTAENGGDYYDIYIGGKHVTSENKNDVLGDGTVSFEYDDYSGDYVVTLNNATITTGSTVYAHLSAIYCDSYNNLRIKLIGDNTISMADEGEAYDYVSGIYSYYHIYIEGEGSLTINADCDYEYGYSYGINSNFESSDLYLEADGEITINMTGAAEEVKGIYAENLYNKNNGDVTVSVSDSYGAYGVYAYNTYLQSPANFATSAAYGEFEDDPYAYGLYTYKLCDSPLSGPVYVEGKTQAIYISDYNNVNMLMLTAYENADDADPVEEPAWSQLSDYEKVVLARASHKVTPVLTTTEAECSWWDDDKGETVGTDGSIEIGWNVGEEEAEEIYLYCDRYSEGYYAYKATIDPTVDSAYVLYPDFDYVLPGATLSWTIGAKFADGTVAFSEPFDLTFYKTRYDYELEIEVDAPSIGYTPDQVTWYDFSYFDSCKGEPTVTWYKMDGETGTPMADDEVFMPGVQYAMIVEGTFVDAFRFDGETLEGTVVSDGDIAKDVVEYDEETNTLRFGALFEPLKDTIHYVGLTVDEPDSTMTSADVAVTVDGYQYSPFSLPIVDGKVTTSWTYCEGDTYDEENAVAMENDEFFKGGNTYRGTVSFKLKDRFALANDVEYVLASGDPFGPSLPLSGTYDATTGIVTVTLPDIMPSAVVKELNMFVSEPEAGDTPDDIYTYGDTIVGDYISEITVHWFELNAEGEAVSDAIASDEEFKPGFTYGMTMGVSLNEDVFESPYIPVTLNGQVPEDYTVDGPDHASISQRFTIPETNTEVDALDFTVSAAKVGDKPADVAVTFDTDKVAYVETIGYEYTGTGDPATDLDGYDEMKPAAVFESGKTYAIDVCYVLKAGFENAEEVALTINGEEPLAAYRDGIKQGEVVTFFTFEEPVLTLSTDATEFTFGDEALKAVNFGLEYDFEGTNRVLVDVVDANGDDVFCTALTAGTETFSVDMSGDDFVVGTYTVTVTAYDGNKAVVSNSVDVVVKPAPTTTESTTETTTETEPTATGTEPSVTEPSETEPSETEPSATEPSATEPSATEPSETEPSETEPSATEPSATETEPTTTGTQADEILYGDANGDGEVNMKDVLTLRKHLAGIEIMLYPLNADANGDGEINMKDVLMIRKYMADLIPALGPTA